MDSERDIVRLTETQLEPAADVLARAFSDDPFAIHVLPDVKEREDLLFWYFGTIIQYGLLFGEVYATANCEGVAVWLPQDGEQKTVDRLQQAGLLDAPDVLGPEAFNRLIRVSGHLERLRRNELPLRHWYLPAVGVDPAHHGRGIGGALLRRGIALADAKGVPCYLETFNERNTLFYRRHGFSCSAESVVPDSDLRYWTFRRDPVGTP